MNEEIMTNEVVETAPEVIEETTKNNGNSMPLVVGIGVIIAALFGVGVKLYRDHKAKSQKEVTKTEEAKTIEYNDLGSEETEEE